MCAVEEHTAAVHSMVGKDREMPSHDLDGMVAAGWASPRQSDSKSSVHSPRKRLDGLEAAGLRQCAWLSLAPESTLLVFSEWGRGRGKLHQALTVKGTSSRQGTPQIVGRDWCGISPVRGSSAHYLRGESRVL